MTDQELRKLSRKDLLELLILQSREQEALRAQLETAKAQLRDRRLQVDRIGSLAEAALQVNGVFEAAQAAAQQYLDNIRKRSENVEALCARREEESRRRCQAMEEEARRKAEAYWTEISVRLKKFYEEHQALRELLADGGKL